MFDLKHKSPNSYVLFVYMFKYNITYFNTSTPLTQKYGKYFKHNKNNSLIVISPLLQKIRLDKLKQRAYDWNQGVGVGYIYLV